MTKPAYIEKLEERRLVADIKKQAVIGLLLGWGCVIVGMYRLLLVPEVNDGVWAVVALLGGIVLWLALVVPFALTWIERSIRAVGNFIFMLIFSLVLSLVYFLVLFPLALLRKRFGYESMIASWRETGETRSIPWLDKGDLPSPDHVHSLARGRSLLVIPFQVLGYFAAKGHLFLLPILFLLLILGLLLIFLQTSPIAPMIYTLF